MHAYTLRALGARIIGIDTGGTFTDLVSFDGSRTRVAKVPSTPDDPARAIGDGLRLLGIEPDGDSAAGGHVVHGTTVALNALLTGETARVALVTNEGFRDLVELGRQERPDIYALHPAKPEPLVPRSRRFEVPQRIWPSEEGGGFETVREPTADELEALARRVRRSRPESVAVCLLHSWAAPEIEERVAAALRGLGLPLTLSAAVLPEHREYERFSTALVNAALAPLMTSYLGNLGTRIGGARLSLMQSSGGLLSAERAAAEPVRVVLSGPAGGVVGAARAAGEAGFDGFACLDMGGTSTDVAFASARSTRASRASRALEPVEIAGHPVGVPSLDIHTIGCGGGSRVTVDAGGILHVGPESAGADPGPVCYGRSDVPTVTDAHVYLGHVAEGPFLSGGLALDHAAVQEAFEDLGRRLGATALEAARGVLDVARAAMRRAIGVMTMQRGQDPERLPLVAFGGAGGLHAAALAESLGMRGALIPRAPGALSALGMTSAEPIRDETRTVLAPLSSWTRARRRAVQRELGEAGRRSLAEAGFPARAVRLEHGLDLRYRGQSFEIHVPDGSGPGETGGKDPEAAFHRAHAELYGYDLPDREVELVCLRTRASVPLAPPRPLRVRKRAIPPGSVTSHRRAVFDRPRKTPVIDRGELRAGHAFDGPALVEEYSGTTLVPPGWTARVTSGEHLLLESVSRGSADGRSRKRRKA